MTDDTRPSLAEYLTKHYATLKRRVTYLLGNGEMAADALHDAWLRLHSKDDVGPVQSPASYLVRVAVNIALDVHRRHGNALSLEDVESLMAMSDSAPGPARTAESRSEVELMLKFIDRMPERRRKILLLVRLEGMQQKEVANLLGVSLRVVENELKRAHDYLDSQMSYDKNC
jgi:RNA polymerase sigma factor (sigma-70 family)